MALGRTRLVTRPPIALVNRRAAELRAAGRELLDLGQAIVAMAPPPEALARVERFLREATVHGYTPDPGTPEALEAVADFLRTTKGIPADPREVMLTCGANQAFANAVLTLTDVGDEVVVLSPYYFDHVFAIRFAGAVDKVVPLAMHGRRLVLDTDALRAAVTPRTRIIAIVSPANPAGMVLDEAEISAICAVADEIGAYVVADETYDLLTFPPRRHVSPRAATGFERVLTVGSFSKTFALASWRIGYVHGPAAVMEEMIKVQDALVVCAPLPSQLAAVGALEGRDAFVARVLPELRARRDALLGGLDGSKRFDPLEPEGATFVLARITDGTPSVACSTRLLEEEGIISVPGSAFGPDGEGYVRLSYGNQPVEVIEEACRRLTRFAEGHGGRGA